MDPIGITTVVVVLVAGTAVGIWRARTGGRLRDVQPTRSRTANWSAPTVGSGSAAGGSSAAASGSTAESASAMGSSSAAARSAVDNPAVGGSALATVDSAAGAGGVSSGGGPAEGWAAETASNAEPLDPALLAALGVEPGARRTLLQFSSAYCAPCRAVRRVSAEVADQIPGVRHVEVDAESHLDAVRALGIWRTPTLLVLDGDGRVTKRATGVPTKPHLIAALEG